MSEHTSGFPEDPTPPDAPRETHRRPGPPRRRRDAAGHGHRRAPEDGEPGPADMVSQPAKVMRIGSMIKQLLEEVRSAPLDEAGRNRLAEIHERSLSELEDGLSADLVEELRRIALPFAEGQTPSESELRIAQAQLVGWLEGLFHGIQTALVAQQMAAQAQLQEMRARCPAAASPAVRRAGPGATGCRACSPADGAVPLKLAFWRRTPDPLGEGVWARAAHAADRAVRRVEMVVDGTPPGPARARWRSSSPAWTSWPAPSARSACGRSRRRRPPVTCSSRRARRGAPRDPPALTRTATACRPGRGGRRDGARRGRRTGGRRTRRCSPPSSAPSSRPRRWPTCADPSPRRPGVRRLGT